MRSQRIPAGRLIAALVLSLATFTASASAATPTPRESLQQLLGQVRSGQVIHAIINRGAHDVKVTLADRTHRLASYPPAQASQIIAQIQGKVARTQFATHRHSTGKKSGHRLRYIVGGIVLALLVLGGVLFLVRRRRPPEAVSGGEVAGAQGPSAPGVESPEPQEARAGSES